MAIRYIESNKKFYNKFTHKISLMLMRQGSATYRFYTSLKDGMDGKRFYSSIVDSIKEHKEAYYLGKTLKTHLSNYGPYMKYIGCPHLYIYTSDEKIVDLFVNTKIDGVTVDEIYYPHDQLEELSEKEKEIGTHIRIVKKLPKGVCQYTAIVNSNKIEDREAFGVWMESNKDSIYMTKAAREGMLTETIRRWGGWYSIGNGYVVNFENITPLMMLRLIDSKCITTVYKNVLV